MTFDAFHLIADRLTCELVLVAPGGTLLAGNPEAFKTFHSDWLGQDLTAHVEAPERLKRYLKLASRSATALPGALSLRHSPGRWRFDASSLVMDDQHCVLIELRRGDDAAARFLALNAQLEKLQAEVRRRAALEKERQILLESEQSARAEAEAANRLKDDFLASVSHELRTPLHAISGWVEVLRARPDDLELRQRGLDVIERNVHVQTRLTEDLMDTSLLITGRLKLEVTRVDLETVVRQAVDIVRPLALEKEQRLEVITNVGSCLVDGDVTRLLQLFGNLLTNAVRYTPNAGKIQVLLRRIKSHAEVTISDTGTGISADVLPYVFDRFRRSDASSTRRHGGLGLGLAIVRHLVELHGGVVFVHSEGTNQGSVFTVSLPLPLFRQPPAATTTLDASPTKQLSGVSVLLVEDHTDSRELLEAILSTHGASVIAVPNSAQAQQAFQSDAPDIVISDIEMPDEDGFTMMRKLRNLETQLKRTRTPAIAVSAHALENVQLHALQAGYQSFLAKPLRSAELIALVLSLINYNQGGPNAG